MKRLLTAFGTLVLKELTKFIVVLTKAVETATQVLLVLAILLVLARVINWGSEGEVSKAISSEIQSFLNH